MILQMLFVLFFFQTVRMLLILRSVLLRIPLRQLRSGYSLRDTLVCLMIYWYGSISRGDFVTSHCQIIDPSECFHGTDTVERL